MTHEEKLAATRRYYRDRRDYCKIHHLCYECMAEIDEGGTQTHCATCRQRRNWLARENRKTWSAERLEKERMAQKRWRFEHPERVKELAKRHYWRRKEQNEGD